MRWRSLKVREKRLAMMTLAVAFCLVNYLLVAPWWNRLNEQEQALRKLRGEAGFQREAIGHVGQWREELSRLTQEKEGGSGNVGSQEVWMKHFEELAGKSGVQLIQRRSVQSEEKSKANQLRVECSFQGNLSAVVRFLWALAVDAAHPQVEVCQLAPTKPGDDKLRGQLTLVVGLKPSS
jgi:alkylhydroperoxidase/carboxymuconolactone decarboxylase family protein YurZ